jgi:multidrug efflux system outer membrane protein
VTTLDRRFGRLTVLAAVGACLASACTLGPNYQRPPIPVPLVHRFADEPRDSSLADLPWWDVMKDPVLQALLKEALIGNLDLRVATARVTEARAQYGVARSFLFPEVGATADYSAQQASRLSEPPGGTQRSKHFQNWNAGLPVSWEIDLFGRIRREKQAAFATYLSTEHGRRAVVVTLVADVASTYLLLRELDLQLEIARRTVGINDETVRFYTNRLGGGVSNRLELDRASANRSRTAAVIPRLEQQLAIRENALSVLLGRPPGPVARGQALEESHVPPEVPAGLPAMLLERRPDVLAAEQDLVAANANVGAAKALFFPTISLTGLLGTLSGDFSNLLRTDANVWQVSPSLFTPIFQGGRIRNNYDVSKARREQAAAQYQKAALNSYREVANALVSVRKLAEVRVALEDGVAALRDAATLARSRYNAGLANYLEILNADQELFEQELQLAQARGEELRAFVDLYRALGGGWQQEHQAASTDAPAGSTSPSAPIADSGRGTTEAAPGVRAAERR